ncbi:MAG: GFA family protein [Burkholderiales bacterium]|nr:GFA family protein [Burkholderiales bacterium]MDE1925813.1 GFA family protein [Burkholderiales bacterium]MDE2160981.1 GFA family protein [Burkholderiales bacterium]MDE2503166.1 GFA family protein [Burkholderiales bacterium]
MQPIASGDPGPPAAAGPSPSALSGHCRCGAVTITVDGAHDPRVGACHCRMCQRWSGGLFLCFEAEVSAVTVHGDVTRYRSSPFAERAFCPCCGTHLWFNDVEEGGQPSRYPRVDTKKARIPSRGRANYAFLVAISDVRRSNSPESASNRH